MKICENGVIRDLTMDEIKGFEETQRETPEPDRLTALELAVAELGAVMGGMSNG